MSFFWYSGSSFVPIQQRDHARIIIDSFLLTSGRVRGLELHLKRFDAQIPRVLPANFPEVLTDVLPVTGQWFPRLEYDLKTQEIYLRLRHAPRQRTVTTLAATGVVDPRERPQVKGWDLPILTELRIDAEKHGYDDVVLLDSAGYLKETTSGVMAFWHNDTLHTAAPSMGILPSVTLALTKQALERNGMQVRYGVYDWMDFRSSPSVVGNALHGWTDVSWESEQPSDTAAWLNSLIAAKDPVKNHNS